MSFASLGLHPDLVRGLKALGYNRTDRKYMIFGESKVYCGIGTFNGDTQPGTNNRSNGGPGYGRSDSGCWAASGSPRTSWRSIRHFPSGSTCPSC